MRYKLQALFWSMALLLTLAVAGRAQHAAAKQVDTTADEAVLRQLATDYFGSYPKRDLAALMGFWSIKSPSYESRTRYMQVRFTERDKIELKDFKVCRVKVTGDRGFVRVEFDMSAVLVATGKSVPGLGMSTSTVRFVRENGQWKIWVHEDGDAELANELLDAGSPEARATLLAAENPAFIDRLIAGIQTGANRHMMQGRYAEAHDAADFGLEVADRFSKPTQRIRLLMTSADIYRNQGELNRSVELFHQALVLAEQANDKGILLVANEFYGVAMFSQGDYAQGFDYLQRAYALKDEAHATKATTGELTELMGTVMFGQGNYGKALELYQKAAEWRGDAGGLTGTTSPWMNIGAIYSMLGDNELALKFFKMSLDWNKKEGNKGMVALTLANIGVINHAEGRFDMAAASYRDCLEVAQEIGAKPQIGLAWQGLGNEYEQMGQYGMAVDYYKKALQLSEEINDYHLTASILIDVADLEFKQGHYPGAISNAERAAKIGRDTNNREAIANGRTKSGRAYLANQQLPQASQAFTDAIATIEAMRADINGSDQQQERFLETRTDPYTGMVQLLYEEGKSPEALAMAERAKGRVLLDILRNGHANITKSMTAAEQAREQKLLRELNSLNGQVYRAISQSKPDQAEVTKLKAQLEKTRHDHEVFQSGLYAEHPELRVQRGEAGAFDLTRAAHLIPDNATSLLEFVVMEDKTLLFVMSGDAHSSAGRPDVKVYALSIKRKELTETVSNFREQLARHDLVFRTTAGRLFSLLLGPAEAQLQGKSRLIIVPDGPLWEMPFQALQTPDKRYLIERASISYAPSLSVLFEMGQMRHNGGQGREVAGKLLAYGNPALGRETMARAQLSLRSEGFEPLPEAEAEVTAVARLYGGRQSKVYVGAAAREGQFKAEAGDYRILHLATHAVLNDTNPMYSHIVLAQDDNSDEDGLLEAWEIMNLKLKADLVVLSACETARGRFSAGEGIIGLTWALFVAGAPTSVVSQWKVDSASTTELMVEFHNRLKINEQRPNAPIGKAEALRQAALKLLHSERYSHPFYWAGFVVMGDGS